MAFIRRIKKKDAIYLAKVESYRQDGKVKQRVLEYIGKELNGLPVQKVDINFLNVLNVQQYADVNILFQLLKELNLPILLGAHYKPICTLLIAHLLCKSGKSKISTWIRSSSVKEIIGISDMSTESLYTSLDYLESCDFEKIERHIQDFWIKLAPTDTKSFVLDVTDTYYHGKHDDTPLRKGKDGKVAKLIQIGLGVSFENGFPIFHQTYKGNISNIKVLEDMMRILSDRGISTLIMDRGFYSEANMASLHKLKMKFIVGVKKTTTIQRNIIDNIKRDEIYSGTNQVALKETFVYIKELPFLFGKLIVIYNPKYEALKRDKMLAQEYEDSDVKYVGFSLIFHNTPNSAEKVVRKYFEKDVIERSFRSLKGDIQLHPIRLWLPQRVNAHIKLCYLALCILSLIKFKCSKLNVSPMDALTELKSIYKVNLKHSLTNKQFTKIVTLTNFQKKIIQALGCSV